MSGSAIETFLARLYTEAGLRADFAVAPRLTAERAGLSRTEAESVAQIDCFALHLTAQTFERKRARCRPSAHVVQANPDSNSPEARVVPQWRQLGIDEHEHHVRRAVVSRALQLRERLRLLAQRHVHLGEFVRRHVARPLLRLKLPERRKRRRARAATGVDIGEDGQRV